MAFFAGANLILSEVIDLVEFKVDEDELLLRNRGRNVIRTSLPQVLSERIEQVEGVVLALLELKVGRVQISSSNDVDEAFHQTLN